jgi:hypothetical protein
VITSPKYKDLGSPTISCTIGEYLVERALLDLRASINLLPFTVYQQMGLGDLKPTFGSMTAELNIFNVIQQQLEDDECHYVNLIDTVVQEEFNRNCFSNPLETLLTNSVDSYDIAHDAHLTEICSLLDSS